MELNIFGYQIKKKSGVKEEGKVSLSPVAPSSDDGSIVLTAAASYYGVSLDQEGSIRTENDLIRRYRETALYPDVNAAIEDIVNEAISIDADEELVKLNLEKLKISDGIKKKFEDEFKVILRLLKFNNRAHELFKIWYIDGRMHFHFIIEKGKEKQGITELRYIDPRKIKKIKNLTKVQDEKGFEVVSKIEEYYIYSEKGVTEDTKAGVKMSIDSIAYIPSGNFDANSGMSLSFLHSAIKPTNQLRMLEDSMVVARITRAPERRIFYVDVGTLPKMKAEQYVTDIMNKFKNKVVYDSTTGELKDGRKHQAMVEDIWMPRRGDGKATEITTLPGLQNMGNIDDVQYFQTKLNQSLNVPSSRMEQGSAFNIGRSSEISRDEIKFAKFVTRLRRKFSLLFLSLLKYQLISKGIIRADEWEELSQDIKFEFSRDNHYTEMKNNEILSQRANLMSVMDPFVDKYYSKEYLRKNVLLFTDDESKEEDKLIEKERTAALDLADHQGQVNQLKQGTEELKDE